MEKEYIIKIISPKEFEKRKQECKKKLLEFHEGMDKMIGTNLTKIFLEDGSLDKQAEYHANLRLTNKCYRCGNIKSFEKEMCDGCDEIVSYGMEKGIKENGSKEDKARWLTTKFKMENTPEEKRQEILEDWGVDI